MKRIDNPNITARKYIFLSCSLLLLAVLCFFASVRQQQNILAEHVSPSVLRFHILADSDRAADQDVKLEVRSLIMDYLSREMAADAQKEDTVRYLNTHTAEIEHLANQYLADRGFDYQARLELTNCYFPLRTYGTLTFPAGYYDAARIVLGRGAGHNWWCVLYPRFCFVDAACTEIPEKTLKKLKDSLKQDDYLALQDSRPEVKIGFFLFPLLNP